MQKKRLFTGLQPSGDLHLGNYFGVLKPLAEMYAEYDGFLMVADYHALTTVRNADDLRQNTIGIVKNYIASGIDPKNAVIFQQSQVLQHTELAWILECLVTVPFLMQAHAYKDKTGKGLEANAGLFNYPMLMAADILLYDTQVVPVGSDQKQHVEYAREAATKFNLAYKETFVMPQEHILETVGTIPGIDGQKMSKSYKNTIPLFATKEEITKAVMSIVTGSGSERPENVYAIHRLVKTEEELAPLYEEHKGKYQMLKEALAQDLNDALEPIREKRESVSDIEVRNVLEEGSNRAREIAEEKMKEVRRNIGIST